MKKLKICVSACLLGFKYRYDGTSDFSQELVDQLKDIADLIPFCPEVECGLPVPRNKMHIQTSAKGTRLIVTDTGEDLTEEMNRWADVKLDQLAERKPDGFIFHSKSPCCGLCTTKLYNAAGKLLPQKSSGLFAAAFRRRFPNLPAGDETNPEDFLKKIHVLRNPQK